MSEVAIEESECCTDCLAEPALNHDTGTLELDGWEMGEFGNRCPECVMFNAQPTGANGIDAVAEIASAKKQKPRKKKKS